MNIKSLCLTLFVVFVGVFASDFLIHGVWLKSAYAETANLWRPEKEMQAHMGWMMLGQFMAAAAMVVLWARGFAADACPRCAVLYGLFMGLFAQATSLINFAVMPLPADLIVKWFIAGIAQSVALGLLMFFVYKPGPKATETAH